MSGRRTWWGFCVAGGLLLGCSRDEQVFDVALEVVEAAAVEGVLERGVVRFSFAPDVGDGDGAQASQAGGFVLDPAASTLRFEVVVDDEAQTQALALGRTGSLAVPATGTLRVPVLLAPIERVGALSDLPPSLGLDTCVASDDAGRIFFVGGSASAQSGYVVDGFKVAGLSADGAFVGTGGVGCAAFGGRVAAVGGCSGDVDARVVVSTGATFDVIAPDVQGLDPATLCGARAVPVDGGVWLALATQLFFVPDGDAAPTVTVDVAARALEAGTDGRAVFVDADGGVGVVDRAGEVRAVRPAGRLGRRLADVLVLDGAELVGLDGVVVRDDISFGEVVGAFTVLSDDTVVALSSTGGRLLVRDPGGTRVLIVDPPRTLVAALPGDTLVLAGGPAPGVSVVALER